MKRLAVMLVVVGLLSLAQAGQAVTLQAGWYVNLSGLSLFGFDPASGQETAVGWDFVGGLGTYGPFEVTNPAPFWPQRKVSVSAAANEVPAGTAVYLYGTLDSPLTFAATRLDVTYQTNYTASEMIAQIYVKHSNGQEELLWWEGRSGAHSGTPNILYGTGRTIVASDQIYAKVSVVPEPPQCLVLLVLSAGLFRWRRKPRG